MTYAEGRYAAHIPAGEYEISVESIADSEPIVVGVEEAITELDLSVDPPAGREHALGRGTRSAAGPGYRQGMWQTYGVADGFPGTHVTDIHQDADGSIWLASAEGLSRYDGEQIVTYAAGDGLAEDAVRSILPDRDGNLWLGYGSDSGLTRFDGVDIREYYSQEVGSVDTEEITCSLRDRNGDLWFGTMDGLIRHNGVTFETVIPEEGWTSNPITSLLEDSERILWIGTMRGLLRYDGVDFTTLAVADGLTRKDTLTQLDGPNHTGIIDLFEDSAGRLWISTGLGLEGMRQLYFDPTTPTALCRYEDGNVKTFEELAEPPPSRVLDMAEDRDGNI